MIKVHNLSKSYGAHPALQGVTLDVEAGDMFGLIGPNGAGKTTLIRILATLLQPSHGTASVDGNDVVRNPGKEKDLDDSTLVKAAQLAAYFSQARNSSKVEVHYTKKKHVTKPRRAKPGLVRLLEFKTIKVEPKNWLNS